MHCRRIVAPGRRERGVGLCAVREDGAPPADAAERRARIDALVDAAVQIYAPLPGRCLADLVRRLRFAVPQWQGELKDALQRAQKRLANPPVNGRHWDWPPPEKAAAYETPRTGR